MREILERILKNYKTQSKELLADNTLANYLCREVPSVIKSEINDNKDNYYIKASCGQGNWAAVPWICVFDNDITTIASEGYYIVYLFAADMSGVYLSLNQGWTYYKNKYTLHDARDNVRMVSQTWKKTLSSTLNDFPLDTIDLKASGRNSSLPQGYELGHICGKYYDKENLPSNDELKEDLINMITVYRELKGKMIDLSTEKTNNYILVNKQIGVFDAFNIKNSNDELNNIIVNSQEFELQLSDCPSKIIKTNVNNPNETKTNYVAKHIKDMEIGLAGEKIVVNYEKNRLINEQRSDLADKVKHVSNEIGDGEGYDILSYDTKGNEKYIEIKTTTCGINTPFYITDNELEFSKEHEKKFFLYRLYDFNSNDKTASLYIVEGNLRDSFNFKAINYIAEID